ncbi:hypothetical protein MPL3365_170009 [Mesorhizobium plurifarium]|uniref:Uncharacterized protein n=1 Tax=Mesorhizobium plurifarium TaxID=69974 RepID=A0A090FYV3_MESPL|nr:hypothetical protein MPL3365_170009 [Mesorhizobium plurifarium]
MRCHPQHVTEKEKTFHGHPTNAAAAGLLKASTHDGLFVNCRHPATGPAGIAAPHYASGIKLLLMSIANIARWPATTNLTGDCYP